MSIVKLNNRGVRSVTAFGSLSSGAMTFIKKLTASSSSTISFLNGTSDVVFDDTYKEYLFTFNNIHPATDNTQFAFQVDTGTNTSYNIACTSTTFRAAHREADDDNPFGYVTGEDQAQGTAFQKLTAGGTVGNDNDQAASGHLHIFNPSSSVFVKHFICRSNASHASDYTADFYAAGYFNTTTALTRVQFKMLSGNIDAGDICLYGIN
tara:strand:+ start:537 stop:1160 length:624 start_codon:yes stop_codon:yes gene_type:complete